MQVKRKWLAIIVAAILIIGLLLLLVLRPKNKDTNEYYYTYVKDDNLISQTVRVYNSKGEIQEKYYLFLGEQVVSSTKADKAIVTISRCNLDERPTLTLKFANDTEKEYKIDYKK